MFKLISIPKIPNKNWSFFFKKTTPPQKKPEVFYNKGHFVWGPGLNSQTTILQYLASYDPADSKKGFNKQFIYPI